VVETPALAPHGWIEVTVQTSGHSGQTTIDVTADSSNEVDESVETNNTNTITIQLP
jgi:subtilase family serine protease